MTRAEYRAERIAIIELALIVEFAWLDLPTDLWGLIATAAFDALYAPEKKP